MPPQGPFRYVSAARSDVGMVRKVNEDACLDRPDLGLWAVADGMGGHEAGDVASRLVVQSLSRVEVPSTASTLLADVRSQLGEANRRLRLLSVEGGGRRTIGSTVVVLMGFGGYYCCLWAGDSRAYLLRGGVLSRITRDHSHVQDLVDHGIITPEAAARHPQANVITRAVGVDDDLVLEKRNDRAQPGDVFLLCSDGLTKEVSDEEIAALLDREDMGEAAWGLVDLALDRGGADNITVVVVRWLENGGSRRSAWR